MAAPRQALIPVIPVLLAWVCVGAAAVQGAMANSAPLRLPKVRVDAKARGFVTGDGRPFLPFGVNYFRPRSGWAPQVWKRFDAEATKSDFKLMKGLGVNCVRVFLTYGSFYMEEDKLDHGGLAKFEQFLALAEAAGVYVHPTGPDHWEGLPDWARGDRIADERCLQALETFWRMFAARYRNRSVIFAYDLLNEPEVPWNSPSLKTKWNAWLARKYGTADNIFRSWSKTNSPPRLGDFDAPKPVDAVGDRELLDYQLFREEIADQWTQRQVEAIRGADPSALVTVGLIQWSVPSLLPGVRHYSGFRPLRQARFLDFLEIHFYPLDQGAYEYRSEAEEHGNLAYLQTVVQEVAAAGKPVVVAEFGWYGGGKPHFDGGRHPAATEAQQARWCKRVVETTAGAAAGWLNWGLYDQPEATDVSELSGLLRADGQVKQWGREFQSLAAQFAGQTVVPHRSSALPPLDWDRCLTSVVEGNKFRAIVRQAMATKTAADRP